MIETLEDYNERLGWCGCCFPELACPEPVIVDEASYANGFIQGFPYENVDVVPPGVFDLGLWRNHRTRQTTLTVSLPADIIGSTEKLIHSGSGSIQVIEDVVSPFAISRCGAIDYDTTILTWTRTRSGTYTYIVESYTRPTISDPWTLEVTDTYTVTVAGDGLDFDTSFTHTDHIVPGNSYGPQIGTIALNGPSEVFSSPYLTQSISYAETLDYAGWIAAVRADISAGEICWGAVAFGVHAAQYRVQDPPTDYRYFYPIVITAKLRFRFRIPVSHTGSYFKITYDIGEFPIDGDPSFVSEDNVIEWTGPGTGLSTDPSWLTPWIEIDPPDVPGQRRIVNIRYTCRHGVKFPAVPQVMGEALEIPPP